jgi:hypothetical protein
VLAPGLVDRRLAIPELIGLSTAHCPADAVPGGSAVGRAHAAADHEGRTAGLRRLRANRAQIVDRLAGPDAVKLLKLGVEEAPALLEVEAGDSVPRSDPPDGPLLELRPERVLWWRAQEEGRA